MQNKKLLSALTLVSMLVGLRSSPTVRSLDVGPMSDGPVPTDDSHTSTLLSHHLGVREGPMNGSAEAPDAHTVTRPNYQTADTHGWHQEAHDAQHTGFVDVDVPMPWDWAWQWNGSCADGTDCRPGDPEEGWTLEVPPKSHLVAGAGKLFLPAGQEGVWAIDESNGRTAWHNPAIASFCTAAYDPDTEALFVAADNGTLYKLNPSTGAVVDSFYADSGLNTSPTIATGRVYVVSDRGTLYAVNKQTMESAWAYETGAGGQTPAAYSVSHDVLVLGTADLYLHAVNNADGSQRWRVKPTVHDPPVYYFTHGWPVIAEQHGVVLMRLRMQRSDAFTTPDGWETYPDTNSAIRSYLEDNPDKQCLFALNLDDGSTAFIPAVGPGGMERPDKEHSMGPQPVVKHYPNGDEVVYTVWRNRLNAIGYFEDHPSMNYDAGIGEMVLDDSTIRGLEAGDLRFVEFSTQRNYPLTVDEMCFVSMAGPTIMYSHWLALISYRITDRSPSLGDTRDNPLQADRQPTVLNRIDQSARCDRDTDTRYCTRQLEAYCDGSSYPGGGFWVFWNTTDPPYECAGAYSDGMKPRYAIANNGRIYYELNGGTIVALGSASDAPLAAVDKESSTALDSDSVDYSISIHANGLALTLIDDLPEQLAPPSSVQVTSGQTDYDPAQHRITWEGSPGLGEQVRLTYSGRVQAEGPTALTNSVTLIDEDGRVVEDTNHVLVPPFSSYLPLVSKSVSSPGDSSRTTGVVQNLTDNRDSYSQLRVPRYGKLELAFDLSREYPNPYYFFDPTDTPHRDPDRETPYAIDGVSVDAHFFAPSGETRVVPAFWYQDYKRERSGEREVVQAFGEPHWKVRYAPSEVGSYRYYLTVQDKYGTSRHPRTGYLRFESRSSESHGFLGVNQDDPRFLAYDDGTSFVGISEGLQYWSVGEGIRLKSYFYDDRLDALGSHGVNLTRIWTQCDNSDGCWALCLEDNDGRGTTVDQENAFRLDRIVEAAERNGIALLTSSVGDVENAWDVTAWTDPQFLDYWRRNFRYRVARYGFSTSVLAWETYNEHGHINLDGDKYAFYQAYSKYQDQTDPYGHLRTTGQGSQVWDPEVWSSSAYDMATYHDYMMDRRYPSELVDDATNFVHRFSQCLRTEDLDYSLGGCDLGIESGASWVGDPKPWIWAEFGVGTDRWNEANPDGNRGEGGRRATHNRMWAGLFSPLGVAPIEWYWYYQDNAIEWYQDKLDEVDVAAEFFSGLDYTGSTFLATTDVNVPNYVGEVVETTSDEMRALAIRAEAEDWARVWVQNRHHTWAQADHTPAPVSGRIIIPGMAQEEYTIERWNTMTGHVTVDEGTTRPNANGDLTVPITDLRRDQAIKIVS